MNYVFLFLNVANGCFTGADYQIDCAYMRARLLQKGINTRQIEYLRNSQGLSVSGLVKYIISETGNDTLAVYIDDYNSYITYCTLFALKNSTIREIVCIGPGAEAFLRNFNGQLNDWGIKISLNIPEIEGEDPACFPHPYSSGILSPFEAFSVGLYASRGCYGKCSFCSYSQNTDISCYSVSSVIKELEFIFSEVGNIKGTICFYDDCFSGNRERTQQLAQAICDLKLPYGFWCTTRADVLDDKTMELLHQAGFAISVGMETASEKLLSSIGKTLSYTAKDYLAMLQYQMEKARKLSMDYCVTEMFFLPGENFGDIATTINFLSENKVKDASMNLMTIFPKSRMFEEAVKTEKTKLCDCLGLYRTYCDVASTGAFEKIYFTDRHFLTQNAYVSDYYTHRNRFLEYHTGICYYGELPVFRKNYLICDEGELEDLDLEKVDLDTEIYVKVVRLEKGKRIYTEDRKNAKVECPQYDKVMKLLSSKGIYSENVSFMIEKEGSVRFKCKDLLERRLLTLPSEHFSDSDYLEYMRRLIEEVYSTQKVNLELFEKMCVKDANKYKSGDVWKTKVNGWSLQEWTYLACFIIKNSMIYDETVELFDAGNSQKAFSDHGIPEDTIYVLFENRGFVYKPSKMAGGILSTPEFRKAYEMFVSRIK